MNPKPIPQAWARELTSAHHVLLYFGAATYILIFSPLTVSNPILENIGTMTIQELFGYFVTSTLILVSVFLLSPVDGGIIPRMRSSLDSMDRQNESSRLPTDYPIYIVIVRNSVLFLMLFQIFSFVPDLAGKALSTGSFKDVKNFSMQISAFSVFQFFFTERLIYDLNGFKDFMQNG